MKPIVQNLLTDLPDASVEERVEVLLSTPNSRLERIISHGQSSPESFWYDQSQAEWVMVLKGHARIAIEDDTKEHTLDPGDSIYLPKHCRHRVTWTDPDQPTIWLALFIDTDGEDITINPGLSAPKQ